VGLASAVVGMPAAGPLADTARKVYIAATNASGAFVTDLTAADITVEEDGKARAVASLKRATTIIDLHLFVEDSGTGAYQGGALALLQALGPRARITITQFSPQAVKLLDSSTSFDDVQGALLKLGRRGRIDAQPAQVAEALGTAARALIQKPSPRPVFVVMTINGDTGHANPDIILDQMRDSGANVHAIYLQTAGIGPILGDIPRESGGTYERIGSVNAIEPAVKKIVDTVLNQYELVYTLPDGVKPSSRVSISTTRGDVELIAPSRVPDR
jgi:hypothetical protein